MHHSAILKAAIWFTFSVVLSVGTPIVILCGLAKCSEKPAVATIVDYFGHSTAPLIAFGLLMAATGDRIVERRSVLSVLRSWVGWMDGVAISLLLLPLYLHFVRGGNPAEAIEVLLGAIPMCFFVGIATKIKYEDWHLTASNNRLLASTAAII